MAHFSESEHFFHVEKKSPEKKLSIELEIRDEIERSLTISENLSEENRKELEKAHERTLANIALMNVVEVAA